MTIMFWIIFVFFGFMAIIFTLKFFFGGLNTVAVFIWIMSIIITAAGSGMLFDNLDEKIFGENIVGEPSTVTLNQPEIKLE